MATNFVMPSGLAAFRRILVTGCPRSGTHIAAKIVSSELGHALHYEREIHGDRQYELAAIFRGPGKQVVQAPFLERVCHQLTLGAQMAEETAILHVHRPPEEVLASMKRVHVCGNAKWQLQLRGKPWTTAPELVEPNVIRAIADPAKRALAKAAYIADFQQAAAAWIAECWRCWEEVQRPALAARAFDIEYSALAASPLFVPAAGRVGWAINQTEAR